MQEKMNLTFVVNRNYVEPLKVFLYSFFAHHAGAVDVYMLYLNLDDDTLRGLTAYCASWEGKKLIPVKVDLGKLSDLYATEAFPSEVYLKLLCADILPQDVSKVLCLDLDMVVNKPLDCLYATDLTGYPVAACKDIYGYIFGECARNLARLGICGEYAYFNSGMLLFNLDYLREGDWGKRMLAFAKAHADNLKWPEQDVMNCLWAEKYLPVNWHDYNCPPVMYVMKNSDVAEGRIDPLCQADIAEITSFDGYADYTQALCDNASIIHYIGETKPWKTDRPKSRTYEIFDRFYFAYEAEAKKRYQEVAGQQ
jgi:lipopolysaccharide biosynthesis glycosyltransferase